MHHGKGGSSVELDQKVPVGDRVHTVSCDAIETKLPGHELPVCRVGDAGQGPGPEGKDVGPSAAVPEPLYIPLGHLEICQQMMGYQDGLGALEVGVAGHYRIGVGLGLG